MTALGRSPRRVQAALEALGLPAEIRALDESTHTAPQAAAAVGCELGAIVKSLVFRPSHPTRSAEALRTAIDPDLLAYGTVWAAAGTPKAVFPVAPEALVEATGGTVAALSARSSPGPWSRARP